MDPLPHYTYKSLGTQMLWLVVGLLIAVIVVGKGWLQHSIWRFPAFFFWVPFLRNVMTQAAYIDVDASRTAGWLPTLGFAVSKVLHPIASWAERRRIRQKLKYAERWRHRKTLFGAITGDAQVELNKRLDILLHGYPKNGPGSAAYEQVVAELRQRGVPEHKLEARAIAIEDVTEAVSALCDRDRNARLIQFASWFFRPAVGIIVNCESLLYFFSSKANRRSEYGRFVTGCAPADVLPDFIESYRTDKTPRLDFDNLKIPERLTIGCRWDPDLRRLRHAVLSELIDGQYDKAFRGALVGHRWMETLVEGTFLHGTPDVHREFAAETQFWISVLLTILKNGFRPSPIDLRIVYGHLVRCKAIEIDILSVRHRVAARTPEDFRRRIKRVRPSLEERIRAYAKSPGNPSLRLFRIEMKQFASDIILALAVRSGLVEKEMDDCGWDGTIGRLPNRTMLIDIWRYRPVDLDYLRKTETARYGGDRYWAFVVRGQEVIWNDLGDAEAIDRRMCVHLQRLSGEQFDAFGRCIMAADASAEPTGAELWRETSEELGNTLLGLARCWLEDADSVVISPDSLLCRLPFETLMAYPDRLLVDHARISYVDSPRDLRHWSVPTGSSSTAVMVIGDPDFNGGIGEYAGAFASLPGTRQEADVIGEITGVQPLTGSAATEDVLKEAVSPRILHIATHGYYLEKTSLPTMSSGPDSGSEHLDRLAVLASLDNPLLRSGLALAGVNVWLAGDRTTSLREDGLLTAQDILDMDLSGTELVVLSACETGLGDAQSAQSVFGLRRTFMIAGARSLVMSLWKVPDWATCKLMESFYRHLFAGKGRVEALQEAQRELRLIAPHPRNWAAFVCLGEPGPVANIHTAGADSTR